MSGPTRTTTLDPQQEALDAILDEALEELDNDGLIEKSGGRRPLPLTEEKPNAKRSDSASHQIGATSSTSAPAASASAAPTDTSTRLLKSDKGKIKGDSSRKKTSKNYDPLDDMMNQYLLSGMSNMDPENADEEATAMLNSFMKQLQTELKAEMANDTNPTTMTTTSSTAISDAAPVVAGSPRPPPSVDDAIDSLLENLSQPPPTTSDIPNHDLDATKMLEEMTREFERFMPSADDNNEDPTDALMNGMMQQLLSKELMYEPMKQVCDKFPLWLETHKETLSSEEYQRRCKQLECFQQLVVVYETEPDNTEKLMTLMERVQEYGQPPAEIVQELAPGLALDDEGMPQAVPGAEGCKMM